MIEVRTSRVRPPFNTGARGGKGAFAEVRFAPPEGAAAPGRGRTSPGLSPVQKCRAERCREFDRRTADTMGTCASV